MRAEKMVAGLAGIRRDGEPDRGRAGLIPRAPPDAEGSFAPRLPLAKRLSPAHRRTAQSSPRNLPRVCDRNERTSRSAHHSPQRSRMGASMGLMMQGAGVAYGDMESSTMGAFE